MFSEINGIVTPFLYHFLGILYFSVFFWGRESSRKLLVFPIWAHIFYNSMVYFIFHSSLLITYFVVPKTRSFVFWFMMVSTLCFNLVVIWMNTAILSILIFLMNIQRVVILLSAPFFIRKIFVGKSLLRIIKFIYLIPIYQFILLLFSCVRLCFSEELTTGSCAKNWTQKTTGFHKLSIFFNRFAVLNLRVFLYAEWIILLISLMSSTIIFISICKTKNVRSTTKTMSEISILAQSLPFLIYCLFRSSLIVLISTDLAEMNPFFEKMICTDKQIKLSVIGVSFLISRFNPYLKFLYFKKWISFRQPTVQSETNLFTN